MFLSNFDITRAGRRRIFGAPNGFEARLLAETAARAKTVPVIFVALDDLRAALIADSLAFFAPEVEVLSFPAWDCLPYDRISPHADVLGQRIATLTRLGAEIKKPTVLLTTVNAIGQRTLPHDALKQVSLDLSVGDEMPIEKLRAFLAASGFVATGTVREVGEFAVRGDIFDLYPSGFEEPVRIDFFGNEIEKLRSFDPLSQTTTDSLDRLVLRPISEVILDERTIAQFRSGYRELFGAVDDSDPLYEAISAGQKFPGMEHWLGLFYPRLVGLLDYVKTAPLFFDWQAEESLKERFKQIEDFYEARQGLYQAGIRSKKKGRSGGAVYKPAPVDKLYFPPEELDRAFQSHATAYLSPFDAPDENGIDAGARRGRDFADMRNRPDIDLYAAIRTYAEGHQACNRRVAIACYSNGSAERMGGLLKSHAIDGTIKIENWNGFHKLDPKLIGLAVLGLEHGFVAPDLVLITEQDILGDRLIRKPKARKAAAQFQMELGSLEVGDFVVHAEHGIGRYEGLETVKAIGQSHDCVKLIYDGGDKLFVPVENLDVLTRYGSADCGAVLDKLGGVAWQSRKSKVKKRLKDMADALLKIAAERSLKTSDIIQVPEGTYQEFAARFPYAETEDQDRAIQSVMDDLSAGKPMDRLVCGDVGFGKTEVALRAAFAAVQAGLQVAVVVPTTLLARQHYNNFVQRFRGFPIRIGQLSRMVPAKEAKQTREEMKEGKVDIVIGTHALLAKDIGFQRLGLMIIDEEQHFGVKQKERLKEMRADVHVLTLTATPIPRTLQLALAGVRELSLITTPPVDRLAVRTFVLPYDPLVIREALMREHFRGGQSFYVCPHIEDLDGIAAELRELVPEIKFITAHGRMSPTELDDIMTAFDAGKFDVLLATNIIESGIDIPNANTIVVHRADRFGLSQLYQLRGRVGRAKLRGYAYLTYPIATSLSTTAQQRLEVIQTLDQLGAGFQLASHDMDIRGAGNLLGEEQSGHIREVGVELYQQMLEDAIKVAKLAGKGEEDTSDGRWTPQINIGMSVLIPETYVPDLNVRIGLYRRLAEGAGADEVEAIAAEIIDRFGPIPPEVENLLQTVEIKQLCRKSGVEKIDAGPNGMVIGFRDNRFAHPEKLIKWISSQVGTAKVRPDQKVALIRAWSDAALRLKGVKNILLELSQLAA
jgi:transcription-repair coupling factor (superfamily II helicase)